MKKDFEVVVMGVGYEMAVVSGVSYEVAVMGMGYAAVVV